MTLESTQLRGSQSLVINYAMARFGYNEIKPYAVITLEATYPAQFTQGASVVHKTALRDVDPTPPPRTGRPARYWGHNTH